MVGLDFRLRAFPKLFAVFAQRKIAISIEHGYRKCGTRAGGLSPTLAHGNSKNEDEEIEKNKTSRKSTHGKNRSE